MKLHSYALALLHMQVVAEHLSVEEVAGIKEAFDMMDSGKRGKINLEEFKIGLRKLGHQIPDADVQILMEAVRIICYSLLLYVKTVCCKSCVSPPPMMFSISFLHFQFRHALINTKNHNALVCDYPLGMNADTQFWFLG